MDERITWFLPWIKESEGQVSCFRQMTGNLSPNRQFSGLLVCFRQVQGEDTSLNPTLPFVRPSNNRRLSGMWGWGEVSPQSLQALECHQPFFGWTAPRVRAHTRFHAPEASADRWCPNWASCRRSTRSPPSVPLPPASVPPCLRSPPTILKDRRKKPRWARWCFPSLKMNWIDMERQRHTERQRERIYLEIQKWWTRVKSSVLSCGAEKSPLWPQRRRLTAARTFIMTRLPRLRLSSLLVSSHPPGTSPPRTDVGTEGEGDPSPRETEAKMSKGEGGGGELEGLF